ncbi:MAG: hypothetical protein Q9162_007816 [Coniocarpon cinnabarinum]
MFEAMEENEEERNKIDRLPTGEFLKGMDDWFEKVLPHHENHLKKEAREQDIQGVISDSNAVAKRSANAYLRSMGINPFSIRKGQDSVRYVGQRYLYAYCVKALSERESSKRASERKFLEDLMSNPDESYLKRCIDETKHAHPNDLSYGTEGG